jgi:CubicO group peptidase (beta-lactamase class C family)
MSVKQRIDGILDELVKSGGAPGVVAIAVNEHGPLYRGAAGKKGVDRDEPMTVDTLFWYASMTKALVATGAMQLVEQGRIDLDAPVGALLPDLAAPQVLEGFAEDGSPRLRPAKRAITARHLLTHTAGFGYNWANGDILRYLTANDLPDLILCQRRSLHQPLLADPGEKWEYGISIDWIGQLIEAISGQSLRDYLKQRLFAPLGMNDTDFIQTDAQRRRRASVHEKGADGSLVRIPHEVAQEPEFFMGGGGCCGAPDDYAAFIQMMLAGGLARSGARVLKPETVAAMAANSVGDLSAGVLNSVMPNLSHSADFFPGISQRWGMSFHLNMEPTPEGRSAGSLSWAGLANTYFWIDRAQGVGGVILTQVLPFADPAILAAYRAFERAIYDELAATKAA